MFDVITLKGAPRERGRRHGEARRDKLIANCEATCKLLLGVGLDRHRPSGSPCSNTFAFEELEPAWSATVA